ncbi:MAG: HAMP domain-containing sensor histidine kinase [Dysgonamonadaceae bacterium]|mgnify:CR=1 FL=1|jgi:signal transduction histidine kinase|nr:HAMP domain-containing sensor histidine kinase [Fermentimonas sp.]MDD3901350.1 HAMP domain-containing sensor histidine kinase [Dysgonamonadaceae bacterium]MDD4399674.1 HAMP domain-containing sensor histidine kinase [Dysgonamonadaceae bacterium]
MKIKSKHIFFLKITVIVLLSLAGAWLFWKNLYFSAVLMLIGVVALAISLYYDRIKLIERMGRMIGGIRNADFSTHFKTSHSDDELDRLKVEMNEALEMFRARTHDSMMEEAESKAWQKLISVLTHEIMNSIAPIISLSETLAEREVDKEEEPEEYKIMKQAMETIHRRSRGLLLFVENYRKLTRLPQPVLQPIVMKLMMTSLQQLTSSKGFAFSFEVYPEQLILNADKGMVEQLLLNLLKNAKEACEGKVEPKIDVRAEKIGDNVRITVSDNGQGISPDAQEKIFIPFYSTKAHGSGIGLSLCRQIVIRHRGKISVQSDNKSTLFIAEFPE